MTDRRILESILRRKVVLVSCETGYRFKTRPLISKSYANPHRSLNMIDLSRSGFRTLTHVFFHLGVGFLIGKFEQPTTFRGSTFGFPHATQFDSLGKLDSWCIQQN